VLLAFGQYQSSSIIAPSSVNAYVHIGTRYQGFWQKKKKTRHKRYLSPHYGVGTYSLALVSPKKSSHGRAHTPPDPVELQLSSPPTNQRAFSASLSAFSISPNN
jgi:hypothetical protein